MCKLKHHAPYYNYDCHAELIFTIKTMSYLFLLVSYDSCKRVPNQQKSLQRDMLNLKQYAPHYICYCHAELISSFKIIAYFLSLVSYERCKRDLNQK